MNAREPHRSFLRLPHRLHGHVRNRNLGAAMMKPLAVVLAFEPEEKRQNVIADTIRQHWHELIAMKPLDRKARIDELLKPEKRNVRS